MKCECFDFPCSWDFYRAHCIEQHGFDPGNINPQEQQIEPIDPPEWDMQQWAYVKQLKGQMLHLEKKVDTLTTKKRKERSSYD